MSRREELIALALKYDGEYFKMIDAIKKQEKIKDINHPNCITILDKEYPKSLLDLKYPPLVLFYKGDISLLKDKEAMAIVGTRKPTNYSLKATEELINQNNDKTFISGLAHGIDAKVHQISNKSIGVLGCGINYIYPTANKHLFDKVEKMGLIISEYPDKVTPLGYHFPFRNRIIAALSKEVNVMELTEKSGTMTTVNEALELGKEIKVLPFSVFEDPNIYNNKLINEGASIIELSKNGKELTKKSPEEILNEVEKLTKNNTGRKTPRDPYEKGPYQLKQNGKEL